MAQTTWVPRTNFDPQRWLLTNGEIIDEPPLEETLSGRKVRVAGTTHSVFNRDVEKLVEQAITDAAGRRKARPWMELSNMAQAMRDRLGYTPQDVPSELYVVNKTLNTQTLLWWHFKHAVLPIEAYLTLRAGRTYPYAVESGHRMVVDLTTPYTAETSTSAIVICVGSRAELDPDKSAATEPLEAILGSAEFRNERDAVQDLLARLRRIDELGAIQLPGPESGESLELELSGTNMHSGIVDDLVEYLEAGPSIEKALHLYEELQACLRSFGVVVGELNDSDFRRGLLNDDPAGLSVPVMNALTPDGTPDSHNLRMHLPTGTFIMECRLAVDYNQVADRWDEAKTIAALSGEEDTLMAFAREYVRRGQNKKSKATIRKRNSR